MFVSLDTDIRGAVVMLDALARVNVLDCITHPELGEQLIARLGAPPGSPGGLRYRTENVDEWSTFAVEAWRDKRKREGRTHRPETFSAICGSACSADHAGGVGEAWGWDCEDFAAAVAAAYVLILRDAPADVVTRCSPVEVVITQPRDHGIAHAYNRIGGRVVDYAVRCGMRRPPPGFYGAAETAAIAVDVPTFSQWRARS